VPNNLYPPPPSNEPLVYGVLPVDFLLETILDAGIAWYRSNINNSKVVFGWLGTSWLNSKYGQAKIDEIWNYINKYELPIVQHFALIDQTRPCISIQLLDGSEMIERTGLADHGGVVDTIVGGELTGRKEIRYSPIVDNIHIGIHVINTPDLAKYIYYLVIYILNAFKPQLEERGLQLSTFRATDISRLNEYLPENMYSRFVNFSVFSIAKIDAGDMPIVDEILGIHMTDEPTPILDQNGDPWVEGCDGQPTDAEKVTDTFGLHACDIKQEND
jgi:hypothetical protein